MIKTIQIVEEESDDVVVSVSEENGQIVGICKDGFILIIDGKEVK